MAKRRCAESYEAAGTRESCWLVGVDTVKVSFSSKVAGGMSSQKGAPLSNTSVSFSRTLLPFPVVSFPFLCVFGFAFGSSRKARTSVVLRLPLSSAFVVLFFPLLRSCACQLGLVRLPRTDGGAVFISSSRELFSLNRCEDAREIPFRS